jgi:hypothetical protein
MNDDDQGIYNPNHWRAQLSSYPSQTVGGRRPVLTPGRAGPMLVNIVLGIEPKAAFALCFVLRLFRSALFLAHTKKSPECLKP